VQPQARTHGRRARRDPRRARCERRDILVYVGGMFEVGVGRRQLRDLASVLCPDAPNDLAAIPLAETATNP
jgi:hypothetical protein